MAIFSSNISKLSDIRERCTQIAFACERAKKQCQFAANSMDGLEYSGQDEILSGIDAETKALEAQKEQMDNFKTMMNTIIDKVIEADRLKQYGTTDPSAGNVYVGEEGSMSNKWEMEAIAAIIADVTGYDSEKIKQELEQAKKEQQEQNLKGYNYTIYDQYRAEQNYAANKNNVNDPWYGCDLYTIRNACGCACTATALSAMLGKSIYPKDIVALNGGGPKMQWDTVAEKYGLTCGGCGVSNYLSKVDPNLPEAEKWAAARQMAMTEDLDKAIENYRNDPEHYSPPILQMDTRMKGKDYDQNHYVLVMGKNPDGTYQIKDSSGNYNTTFCNTEDSGKYSAYNNTFIGKFTGYFQYEKK